MASGDRGRRTAAASVTEEELVPKATDGSSDGDALTGKVAEFVI